MIVVSISVVEVTVVVEVVVVWLPVTWTGGIITVVGRTAELATVVVDGAFVVEGPGQEMVLNPVGIEMIDVPTELIVALDVAELVSLIKNCQFQIDLV